MIYDNIDNHKIYDGISKDIRTGLEYLHDMKLDVEKGEYELTPRVKVIISEYTTKEENEYGFEGHQEYIDIQYLISGAEKICYLPLEYLKETKSYNKEIDAAFYVENEIKPQELLLGNGYFTVLFPQDGHMPQLCADEPITVKKVVIKVKI